MYIKYYIVNRKSVVLIEFAMNRIFHHNRHSHQVRISIALLNEYKTWFHLSSIRKIPVSEKMSFKNFKLFT